jgi:hypothetical protein
MVVRMKELEGSTAWVAAPAPSRVDVPHRTRHQGRGRRIRFVVWTVLLVVLICLVGAVASPARTAHRSHPAAYLSAPAAVGLDPQARIAFRTTR